MTHATRFWDATVTLDGTSIYDKTGGTITIKEVEDGNMTATLTFMPAPGTIDPNDWAGKAVVITIEDESTTSYTKFTGKVRNPQYDPITRKALITCTQDRNGLLSGYTEAGLETLIGGHYSPYVFDADADLPTIAADRLSTVSASLNFTGDNTAVLTDWAAKTTPDTTLADSDILRDSISVTLVDRDKIYNSVDVNFKYRFTRLRHREYDFTWDYPGGMSGYIANATTIPFRDQILQAATATGLVLRPGYTFDDFGASGWYDGISFVISDNERAKYCLGADFTLARRFSQSITEDYVVTVKAPQSITQFGEIKRTRTYGMTAEYDASDWDDLDSYQAPSGTASANGDTISDKDTGVTGDRTEFETAIKCAQAIARADILQTHRQNIVSFECKTIRPDLELSHTVSLPGSIVTAKGKLTEIEHVLHVGDEPGWKAITRCKMAVSKIQNTAPTENAIGVPAAPDTSDAGPAPTATVLGSHYGNHAASVAYDEDWDGHIGNYALHDAVQTMEIYPKAFIVDAPEVDDADRNDREESAASDHEIAIPNETLSMT